MYTDTIPPFLSCDFALQDHLYSGWLTRKHCALVERYLRGVRDGTAHTLWKDETWDRDHPGPPDGLNKAGDDNEANNDLDPSGLFNIGRKGKK